MSNILNHNRDIFQFDINKEDYWDFHLCIDNSYGNYEEGLVERCLSAYIDLSDDECIWFDEVYSKRNYVWDGAVNDNELSFNSFGYVSVDNGRTHYEKDRITNREFFDIYTKTTFQPQKDDLRFTLAKVRGNHQLYNYSNEIMFWNDSFQVSRLNGGWYQGFFCADDGLSYKTLPTDIGNGWNFEIVLNKEDFAKEGTTLNDIYPENKGIFFYIGTRSENKWWIKYLTDHDFDWCKKSGFADDYVEDYYASDNPLNDDYFKEFVEMYESEGYFGDDYIVERENDGSGPFTEEYMEEKPCNVCENYVTDEYYEKDLHIDENMDLKTEDGFDMYQPNIKEFRSDNKFLLFDRTCEGVTTKTYKDGMELVVNYIEKPDVGNYFTMFHKGCGGYDVNKIKELLSIKSKKYNVLQDLYRNALAFQIKDDGSIGYKYLVKDCESEEEKYAIETEFTNNTVINNKLWYTINVKILPVKHIYKGYTPCLTCSNADDKMQIYIYVNGKLVLVSKVLPILNLKRLNDLDDKQQGVPFNISLGGGTQGLAEVVYLNYKKLPEYTLPLEKEFGGSFVGWLKSFKFYTCPLKFNEIVRNYNFTKII